VSAPPSAGTTFRKAYRNSSNFHIDGRTTPSKSIHVQHLRGGDVHL
jgi:hypothetical protein